MQSDGLRVMIVGGGGREHALAWKINASPRVSKVFCAPGNAGTASLAENLPVKASDLEGIVSACREQGIHLVVVGPESPLIAGLADRLEAEGIPVFGPSMAAAKLEGSKVFTKELLDSCGVPTAKFQVFDDPTKAFMAARHHFCCDGGLLVIKADGEAAGKGVIIAEDETEAVQAIDSIMVKKVFGASGDRVVLEDYLEGEEASIMAIVDGERVKGLLPAQDYKRAFDNDEGPNTGGMGCYSPVPAVTPDIYNFTIEKIIRPTLTALMDRGIRYRGVLYAGIMITADGAKLLEYNCRFGDPETQVVLPLMETDLVDVIEAALEGGLDEITLKWYNKRAVCVVMASGGYPGDYKTGEAISGIADAEAEDALVFHAGTASSDGRVVTSGGRVLGVTALGADFHEAVKNAYRAVDLIKFEGMHFRKDIGARVL